MLDLRSVAFSSGYSTDILGGNTIQLWSDVGHSSLLASFHLAAPVATGTFVDWQSDGAGGTSIFLDDNPCYAAGTHILTATGERMVESLMQGDIVLTLSNGELSAQPVKWIGRRPIDLTAHPRPETAAPIRIRRGAFADNMPHRDLLVSPDHAIFVDGKLICARQLVNGTTIRQEKGRTAVEYFHVELDSHAILLAEGLPAESYLNTGNHGFFINSGGPLVLHPDMTDETDYPVREAGSCAPFVSDEASVRPVWQRLAERAAALGQPAPRLATTDDPELRIVAKGRTVRPLYGETGLYIFALPKGATEVRAGLACRRADRCAAVAGRSPLPRRERGADRAARRERVAGGSGRSSGPVAGLARGGARRHGAAPVDQRRRGAAAAGAEWPDDAGDPRRRRWDGVRNGHRRPGAARGLRSSAGLDSLSAPGRRGLG